MQGDKQDFGKSYPACHLGQLSWHGLSFPKQYGRQAVIVDTVSMSITCQHKQKQLRQHAHHLPTQKQRQSEEYL